MPSPGIFNQETDKTKKTVYQTTKPKSTSNPHMMKFTAASRTTSNTTTTTPAPPEVPPIPTDVTLSNEGGAAPDFTLYLTWTKPSFGSYPEANWQLEFSVAPSAEGTSGEVATWVRAEFAENPTLQSTTVPRNEIGYDYQLITSVSWPSPAVSDYQYLRMRLRYNNDPTYGSWVESNAVVLTPA